MAANGHGLRDFDDDTSDWLEVTNPLGATLDLGGYYLTDEADDLTKWKFPDGTSVEAGGHLLVFASGKDRIFPNGELHTSFKLSGEGEYLALVEPNGATVAWEFGSFPLGREQGFPPQPQDISYGVRSYLEDAPLVGPGVRWTYRVPESEADREGLWRETGFDPESAGWRDVPGGTPIGFDTGVVETGASTNVDFGPLVLTDVRGEMAGVRSTILLRSEWSVAEWADFDELHLRVQYDDGFVTYLNGHEIARRHAPEELAWDASATLRREDSAAVQMEEIPLLLGSRWQDFNSSRDATFAVDVLPGRYEVTLYQGDSDRGRDQMAVHLEGAERDLLSLAAGQASIKRYDVHVVDGQLTIRLEDRGGATTHSVINALEILPLDGEGIRRAFDFGMESSPVRLDHLQVTETTRYDRTLGYGWLEGVVLAGSRAEASLGAGGPLLPGMNVLAVEGLNLSVDNPDFLFHAELVGLQRKVDRDTLVYMDDPTPGSANRPGQNGVAEEPHFSAAGGMFVEPFTLELTTSERDGVIHYTLDESLPSLVSPVFDPLSPLEITTTTQVRAIVVAPDRLPSTVVTRTYTRLAADLAGFTSAIPIMVLDNFGRGGPIPAFPFSLGEFQNAYWTAFEPGGGDHRSSLTRTPDLQTRVGAQIRGNSSQGFDRKAFRLEAWDELDRDRDVAPLGLPADADWILYADSEFDRSLMNNAFMYALSNQSGLYAVRTRFVEVFVNTDHGELSRSDYLGVYTLMEKVKAGQDRVDVEKLSRHYDSEPQIGGGYVVNLELEAQHGELRFNAGGRNGFQFVQPSAEESLDPLRQPQLDYLKSYMDSVAASLQNQDPQMGYPSLIDVDNWILYHLLSTFARNSDALDHSTYMSKSRFGKLQHGPVWDYDRALGGQRAFAGRGSFEGWQQRDFTMAWWVTLFEHPDFRQAYADRYQQLRSGPWSDENLHGLIDHLAAELSEEAAERTFERWPMPLAGDPPGWPGEVELLRQWVLGRAAWTDRQFVPQPIIQAVAVESTTASAGTHTTVILRLPDDAPAGAQIYYTLDGSDPRAHRYADASETPYESPSASAVLYGGELITLEETSQLRARTYLSAPGKKLLLDTQTIEWSGPVPAQAEGSGPAAIAAGDADLDGDVDFDDITDMVLALEDSAGYQARRGVTALAAADVDRDGRVTEEDIARFVERLRVGAGGSY
jgi:hypothetical protein